MHVYLHKHSYLLMGLLSNLGEKPQSMLAEELAKEILNETGMLDEVKLEDYLMVALGVRPCSFFTAPAEFPDGPELGRKIDEVSYRNFVNLTKITDMGLRRKLVSKLKEKLRGAFKSVVYASPSYKAHLRWAKKLGLRMREVEIRPTIHEFYLFRGGETERKLKKLIGIKENIRKDVFRFASPSTPKHLLIYPEDLSPEYVTSIGELLGYPECCVERYVENRLSEATNVEDRASSQIKESKKRGEKPDPFAYFVRGFFPCNPICQNAVKIGRRVYEAFRAVDPLLGSCYLECLRKNLETVEDYPELIKAHEEKLRERWHAYLGET
ncbi:MAG: hypothetical protein AOA65_0867 [Candidatus Bathyarchaeota archaeon BA1]|nr:MAG: hypothetical protein AOA65_0867 [Candidatus Bathyarchaeota archaeon BA1]